MPVASLLLKTFCCRDRAVAFCGQRKAKGKEHAVLNGNCHLQVAPIVELLNQENYRQFIACASVRAQYFPARTELNCEGG
jgi:hypothetical protein